MRAGCLQQAGGGRGGQQRRRQVPPVGRLGGAGARLRMSTSAGQRRRPAADAACRTRAGLRVPGLLKEERVVGGARGQRQELELGLRGAGHARTRTQGHKPPMPKQAHRGTRAGACWWAELCWLRRGRRPHLQQHRAGQLGLGVVAAPPAGAGAGAGGQHAQHAQFVSPPRPQRQWRHHWAEGRHAPRPGAGAAPCTPAGSPDRRHHWVVG